MPVWTGFASDADAVQNAALNGVSRAQKTPERHRGARTLLLALLAALALLVCAQAFVSGRHALATADVATAAARTVILQESAFAVCGVALVLALYLSSRHVMRNAQRDAEAHSRVEPEFRSHADSRASTPLEDVTELHIANRLATMGRLTAGMAHEFGTPLGVVLARAQMILSDEGDREDARADAKAIVQEVKRMTQICREVLEYARPRPPLNQVTDLVQIARHMLVLLLPDARKRDIKLSLVVNADPTSVLGDASKLMQVLTNLMINALQATAKGGHVVLRVEQLQARAPEPEGAAERAYACVRVEDSGSGIRAQDLPHIFDTFFTTKKEGQGTGLGLSVSSRIAREHGGWIGVKTAEGKGSCFSVYLPLTTPQALT